MQAPSPFTDTNDYSANNQPPACTSTFLEATDFIQQLAASTPVAWTISGGQSYIPLLKQGQKMWQTHIHPTPYFLMAMDKDTAKAACGYGWERIALWSKEAESYSRVADAKFMVTAALAERGIDSTFIEMDVWMKRPIIPIMDALRRQDDRKLDMQLIGHTDAPTYINIGEFMV
jgi:hypothetical protein